MVSIIMEKCKSDADIDTFHKSFVNSVHYIHIALNFGKFTPYSLSQVYCPMCPDFTDTM